MNDASTRDAARLRGWRLLGNLEEAYLQISAIQAALGLGLFERLAAGPLPPARLAAELSADVRGLGVLVDALTSLELLEKTPDGIGLGPAGRAYLVPGEPTYYGDTLRRVTLSGEALGRLGEAVRTGQPLGRTTDVADAGALWAQDIAHSLLDWPAQVDESLVQWDELGLQLPPDASILDLGCGSGVNAFALTRRLPDARFTCVDWHRAVLDVTDGVARAMQIDHRVRTVKQDLRELDLPDASQDLVHASAVLYFYPQPEIGALFKRAFRWLKPGGYLVSRHLLADDDRSTAVAALFRGVQLFLFHPDGYVPAQAELVTAARDAGLEDVHVVDGTFLVARKPHDAPTA